MFLLCKQSFLKKWRSEQGLNGGCLSGLWIPFADDFFIFFHSLFISNFPRCFVVEAVEQPGPRRVTRWKFTTWELWPMGANSRHSTAQQTLRYFVDKFETILEFRYFVAVRPTLCFEFCVCDVGFTSFAQQGMELFNIYCGQRSKFDSSRDKNHPLAAAPGPRIKPEISEHHADNTWQYNISPSCVLYSIIYACKDEIKTNITFQAISRGHVGWFRMLLPQHGYTQPAALQLTICAALYWDFLHSAFCAKEFSLGSGQVIKGLEPRWLELDMCSMVQHGTAFRFERAA